MQLMHTFTVPTGAHEAWVVLRDIERVAPCMPGATLDSVNGDEFTGRVKVKVGPMQVTYRGSARFTAVDEDKRRATIEAKGQEVRGSGTANATITAELKERGDETAVTVMTDLAITGKPAQFGRGVMVDVGEKLLGKFADCLAEELAERPAAAAAEPAETEKRREPAATAASQPAAATAPQPAVTPPAPRRTDDTIDLLDVAGAPVLKRAAPVAAVLAALALIVWLVRRRG